METQAAKLDIKSDEMDDDALLARYSKLIEGLTPTQLAFELAEIQDRKDKIDRVSKRINKLFDLLRIGVIPRVFDEHQLQGLPVKDLGRITLTSDMSVSILPDKKEEAYQFFSDLGKEDIVTTTINASTLKAVVKQMFLAGEEIPSDLIKVSSYTRASLTRSKAKTSESQ